MPRVSLKGLQTAGELLQKTSLDSFAPAAVQQVRTLGGGGVPEFFGRPSKYTPGTDFLGTPPDHLERVATRPVSPHVFEVDGKGFHYRMPINATTSIVNRATGTALTVGTVGVGAIALFGDVPAAITAFKTSVPWLVGPTKAIVAFPIVYHYVGGIRHLIWDQAKIGKQADKTSFLENETVDRLSWAMVGVTAVATLGLSVVSFS